jgi:hypothetical protein
MPSSAIAPHTPWSLRPFIAGKLATVELASSVAVITTLGVVLQLP